MAALFKCIKQINNVDIKIFNSFWLTAMFKNTILSIKTKVLLQADSSGIIKSYLFRGTLYKSLPHILCL